MNGHWLPPRGCTVTGAAHRRRGQDCQDASLACTLVNPNGQPLQLLVVADGHGNRRHWLSAVGSDLACRQARSAVQACLSRLALEARELWQGELQHELPRAIVQGWQDAIADDWAQRPEAAQQAFSPDAYGCTLGLLLLAPDWWGHTGLGDWDLTVLQAGAAAWLASEEAPASAGEHAEATASLCLAGAAQLFAARAGVHAIPPQGLAVVLSTDGVRKSCATDADFLQLCSDLIQLEPAQELRQGLELITAQGSGDDVSVALAQWQPEQWLPGTAPAAPAPAASADLPRPGRGVRATALIVAGGALVALALLGWWRLRPQAAVPPVRSPLQAEIDHLCREPSRIRASLHQRRAQFQALDQGATAPPASRDPLGALIAASRQPGLRACPELSQELQRQWQSLGPAAQTDGSAGRMPAGLPSGPITRDE